MAYHPITNAEVEKYNRKLLAILQLFSTRATSIFNEILNLLHTAIYSRNIEQLAKLAPGSLLRDSYSDQLADEHHQQYGQANQKKDFPYLIDLYILYHLSMMKTIVNKTPIASQQRYRKYFY